MCLQRYSFPNPGDDFAARYLPPAYFSRSASRAAAWAGSPMRKHRPAFSTAAGLGALQRRHDRPHVAIPTCGLLRGSGRWPVAQPNTAGGAAHTDTWCRPPSIRSSTSKLPSSRTVIWSTPWNCSVIPSRSPTICMVDPAPREADSHPPNTSSRARSDARDGLDRRRPAPPPSRRNRRTPKPAHPAPPVRTAPSAPPSSSPAAAWPWGPGSPATPCCPASAAPGGPLRTARDPPRGPVPRAASSRSSAPDRRAHRFQRLQRVGDNAPADHDLKWSAHLDRLQYIAW